MDRWQDYQETEFVNGLDKKTLTDFLRKKGYNDDVIKGVIYNLEKTTNKRIASQSRFLKHLRYGIKLPSGPVELISDNPKENIYTVGKLSDNVDVYYVNGIPLSIVVKANSEEEAIRLAKELSKNQSYASLMNYVQIITAYDNDTKEAWYWANSQWKQAEEDTPYIMQWKYIYDSKTLMPIAKSNANSFLSFLDPDTFINIIKYYTWIKGDDKVVPRHMQYRAAEKIVSRAEKYAKGETNKRKGLIAHYQGSGKSWTMVFAAYKYLSRNPDSVVFLMVDRNSLEYQIMNQLTSIQPPVQVVNIDNAESLKTVLTEGGNNGGIYVVTVQKFQERYLGLGDDNLDENMKKNIEALSKRRDVLLLIDEAQRSQSGVLSLFMKTIFRNASMFGFTGTPSAEVIKRKKLFKKNGEPTKEMQRIIDELYAYLPEEEAKKIIENMIKHWEQYKDDDEIIISSTMLLFSEPDEGLYDVYSVEDALKDGFLVPVIYVEKRIVEGELDLFGIKSLEDNIEILKTNVVLSMDEEHVLDGLRYVGTSISRTISTSKYKTKAYLEKVADSVIKDYLEGNRNKGKAMVVVGDRITALKLLDILKEKVKNMGLPSDIVAAFISLDSNDKNNPVINKYIENLKEKYGSVSSAHGKMLESFKSPPGDDSIHIAIVVDQLTVGADIPPATHLFLAKKVKNIAKFNQIMGRIMRKYEKTGKSVAMLYDLADNRDTLELSVMVYSSEGLKIMKNPYQALSDGEILSSLLEFHENVDALESAFEQLEQEMQKHGIEKLNIFDLYGAYQYPKPIPTLSSIIVGLLKQIRGNLTSLQFLFGGIEEDKGVDIEMAESNIKDFLDNLSNISEYLPNFKKDILTYLSLRDKLLIMGIKELLPEYAVSKRYPQFKKDIVGIKKILIENIVKKVEIAPVEVKVIDLEGIDRVTEHSDIFRIKYSRTKKSRKSKKEKEEEKQLSSKLLAEKGFEEVKTNSVHKLLSLLNPEVEIAEWYTAAVNDMQEVVNESIASVIIFLEYNGFNYEPYFKDLSKEQKQIIDAVLTKHKIKERGEELRKQKKEKEEKKGERSK